MPTIEDIILANDGRGISALRPHLAPNYCEEAASCLMANPGTVLIATGFYIMAAGAPETDGPPGALALGRALETLGRDVFYVADRYTCPIMEPFATDPSQIVDFPISDDGTSRSFAEGLLGDLDPSVIIAIERCSVTREGTYLNMRGLDITAQTARLDYLFHGHPNTVGIGDGGNEIGMGNLAEVIPQVSSLPPIPSETGTTHLVISSVSNWGGYGVVAALSSMAGKNLLPDPEEEDELIQMMVDMGAVDGVVGKAIYSVDGMDLAQHGEALTALHGLIAGL